jgi:hypothetical protein
MGAIMARMSRTTIMADDALLDQLRAIAKEEGISLGEVIREALEWRARLRHRPPSFIGKAPSEGGPSDDARHVDEIIGQYLDEKYPPR